MSLREQLNDMRNTVSRLILNIPALVEHGHWDENTGALFVQRYRKIRHQVNDFAETCMESGRLAWVSGELYRRAISRRLKGGE